MANWNIVELWNDADEEQRRRGVKLVVAGTLLLATALLVVRAYRASQPAAQPAVFALLAVEDHAAVRALIEDDGDDVVGARDVEGNTPLHVAVLIGSEPLVRDLLTAGADPNARNREGRTPLAETAEGKRPQAAIAAALLSAGADPAIASADGQTPLHLAVTTPGADPALAALLARHRPAALALVDAAGRTPLQAAEARGQKRAVAALRQAVVSTPAARVSASVN